MRPAAGRPLLPAALAVLLLLAGLAAGSGGSAAQAGPEGPQTCFERVRKGWAAGSAADVVACVDPEGTVVLELIAWPFSGKSRSMKPEQAEATLKAYFKKLSGIGLEDATPRRSPRNLKLYEYMWKTEGESARTTHLSVRLRQDEEERWVLASVTEAPRPRN